jgi:acetyl/propionyl-CoA carboxylase alpha subunit
LTEIPFLPVEFFKSNKILAEDPLNNFLPDIGKLEQYTKPEGPGVRVDDGYEEGMEIPIYYDPMLAKLIAYGKDRDEAIDRLIRAIDDYRIVGVKNTLNFGKFVLRHPDFVSGKFDTNFLAKHYKHELLKNESEEEMEIAAHLSAHVFDLQTTRSAGNEKKSNSTEGKSNWVKNRSSYRD